MPAKWTNIAIVGLSLCAIAAAPPPHIVRHMIVRVPVPMIARRLAVHRMMLPVPVPHIAKPTIFTTARPNAPTTEPAVFPADAPARTWYEQLASSDPTLRAQAQQNLMDLPPADLPALRTMVLHSAPASPAQIAALHDIVIQIYLSGQPYSTQGGGFLGLQWPDPYYMGMDEPPRMGVAVEIRLPGFPAYAALRTGDMILGVLLEPTLPLSQLPNMRTPTREILANAVQQAAPGQNIELEILRSGQIMRVPLRLAALPAVDDANIQSLFEGRQTSAQHYWETQFVEPLAIS